MIYVEADSHKCLDDIWYNCSYVYFHIVITLLLGLWFLYIMLMNGASYAFYHFSKEEKVKELETHLTKDMQRTDSHHSHHSYEKKHSHHSYEKKHSVNNYGHYHN